MPPAKPSPPLSPAQVLKSARGLIATGRAGLLLRKRLHRKSRDVAARKLPATLGPQARPAAALTPAGQTARQAILMTHPDVALIEEVPLVDILTEGLRPDHLAHDLAALDDTAAQSRATATLYDRVMTLWQTSAAHLRIDSVTIRDEDLIANLRGTVEPILTHTGLTWTPAMDRFHETAKPVIRTASYRQVSHPLYGSAAGRWRHYATRLAPVMDRLPPWIAEFGYDA